MEVTLFFQVNANYIYVQITSLLKQETRKQKTTKSSVDLEGHLHALLAGHGVPYLSKHALHFSPGERAIVC